MRDIVFFRLEAGEKIGLGHLYRCLSLAQSLNHYGYESMLITSDRSKIPLIDYQRIFKIKRINSGLSLEQDAFETLNILQKMQTVNPILVVDNYQLDIRWEKIILPKVARLIVIDDLANRLHACTHLIDVGISRKTEDYSDLIPVSAKTYFGSQFCLLRSSFRLKREQARVKRQETEKIQSILVSFGATDVGNDSIKVINIFNKLRFEGDIHVVTTDVNPHLNELLALNQTNVSVHVNDPCMDDRVFEADLAVGSLGGVVWERFCLGLPSICMVVADNQVSNGQVLSHTKAILVVKKSELEEILQSCIRSDFMPRWHDISKQAFELCDGLGIYRVLNQVFQADARVSISSVTDKDIHYLFELQNQDGSRTFSRKDSRPNWPEHYQWFHDSLENPLRKMWIVNFMDEAVGYVRLDLDKKINREEVSILMDTNFRGLGLGKAALQTLLLKRSVNEVCAYINPENKASVKLFRSAGFSKVNEENYLWKAK